jgi:phospholipid-binding lipoprotein MlaA
MLWPTTKGPSRRGRAADGWKRCIAAALLGSATLLAGCATPPSDDPEALAAYEEANDPLEPMNRYFFEINYAFDETLGKAFAGWYYIALPNFAQDGIRNALRNLRTPVILANDLFQGEMNRAGITIGRFFVNSTLGVGGLVDVAKEMGLEYHNEDFGQTLAVYGVDEGPYLVLPLLGPSNPRDATGRVVDIFLDPLTYIGLFTDVPVLSHSYFTLPRTGLEFIDYRARNLKTLDEIRKGSLDYYATIRSLYRQSRADEIRNSIPSAEGLGPNPEESLLNEMRLDDLDEMPSDETLPGETAPGETPMSETPIDKKPAGQTSTPATSPKLSFLAVDTPITTTAGQ